MSNATRAALNTLIAALERHYEACASKRGEDDAAVEAAVENLSDAFEAYDDSLFDEFDEATPLVLFTPADDDEDFYDEDDEEYDELDDIEELDDDAEHVQGDEDDTER
ncbi:DNA primase [Dermabacteraceae bacterium CCM 9519]